jgi:hypothetical protein
VDFAPHSSFAFYRIALGFGVPAKSDNGRMTQDHLNGAP